MGYLNATGEIKYSLRNDIMFHIVMNKSKEALKGLICALKGLNYDEVFIKANSFYSYNRYQKYK